MIETCIYDDLEHRPTFEMICDILEENNLNLIILSQTKIEDVSKIFKNQSISTKEYTSI